MKSYVLDTNVFLRFLLNDIKAQTSKAAEIFIKAKNKKLKIYAPQIVIFEIVFALEKYYKFNKIEIIEKVGTILATHYINIQDKIVFQEAIRLYKNKKIDFVDCFLLSKTKEMNYNLLTFDKGIK